MKNANWRINLITGATLGLLLYGLFATVIGIFGVFFYATMQVPKMVFFAVSGLAAIYSADWVFKRKLLSERTTEEDCGCPD